MREREWKARYWKHKAIKRSAVAGVVVEMMAGVYGRCHERTEHRVCS